MATMVEVLMHKEDTLRKETEAVIHRVKTKRGQDKQVWAKEKAAVVEINNKLGQALSMEQT